MLKYSLILAAAFSLPQTSPQTSPQTIPQNTAAPPPPTGNLPANLGSETSETDSSNAAVVGNCLTQRIDFTGTRQVVSSGLFQEAPNLLEKQVLLTILTYIDPSRVFNLANAQIPIKDLSGQLDTGRYDLTLDYGNITYSGNGISMLIKENRASPQSNPQGTRISTTRFMKYGKITSYFKAAVIPGVVNSFISAGPPLPDPALNGISKDKIAKDTGDEIDIELLGRSPNEGSNNVFYRGLLEYSKHDQYFNVPNGIGSFNKWAIEWKRDTITFSLNDQVVRTYGKNGSEANSQFLPGVRFFPDRPQKIQMALWADAANSWSGGLPTWPDSTRQGRSSIQYIDVICYDDSDSPVPKWPNTPQNVERLATVPGQPTDLIGGEFPSSAGKQTKGAIMQPPPVMPAGYTGAANKAVGFVADSGSNDGKTIASINGPGNTSQFGKGAGESLKVYFGSVVLAILSVSALI